MPVSTTLKSARLATRPTKSVYVHMEYEDTESKLLSISIIRPSLASPSFARPSRYIHFEICPPPPSHIEAANESRLSALTPASLPIHQPVSSTSISFLSQNHPGPLVPIPRSLKNTILDEDDPVLRYPPSWISADVRKFDLSVLGK